MLIALAQINPVVGDLEYNTGKILEYINKAGAARSDLVVFPELAITGYPAQDLLLNKQFLDAVEIKLQDICRAVGDTGVILGVPMRGNKGLYNAAALMYQGKLRDVQYKSLLPVYDVFDEKRYFEPAEVRKCIVFKGRRLGVTICEDIWNDKDCWNRQRYAIDPLEELVHQGAEIIINLSASPYHYGKYALRTGMLGKLAAKYQVNMVYVNQVGGNDHLIFDGSSVVVNKAGSLCQRLNKFTEDFALINTGELSKGEFNETGQEDIGWIYEALLLGTRDYLFKNGFGRALVGLSGGIDSSVTAAIAAAALGTDNVVGVSMPSRYSSEGSKDDAYLLAENLGIKYRQLHIDNIFKAYTELFNPEGRPIMDLAEENIQARIRGNILMFISNREGQMVLTTGNKSEMAMGYSTIYGDMAGGLSVLADVPKVMVYRLAEYINREKEVIPRNVISKPPSAELRPDQKDEDSLPPYEVLDQILKAYIEDIKPIDEIVAMGFNRGLVLDITRRVDTAEYKRQQAPPGLRVTSRAFGPGRRMPVAQHWHIK
ncbi:Glutamine-dependent NAD(+) synthetase [Sporotomaculum syntrophicum]|uniref:Glutamine-dependent NAD(+) synthetase n=1 Tax=Sporotomaculum syntrophicum TaxID=182264 RepID=A0A9D3AWI7_9FIRM|nr:NAD+ synthase [Sporotomaculum syntrophicum]KAF1085480.1 Glutamine-dependent NAD(+) synthetase [Sporotomaculum syntrophicum]